VTAVLTALVAFVLMEPFTYAAHRWVMHGFGERLHRSHHRAVPSPGWEANDGYPVIFAGVVMLALAVGFNVPGAGMLVPMCIGVTAYGLAYALVHDVYIHDRLPLFRGRRFALLDRLADAHRIHHLYNGEPYGMLLPVVPKELRDRAARTARDPFTRPA
jgi:beta-carotene 3-hydroxylase